MSAFLASAAAAAEEDTKDANGGRAGDVVDGGGSSLRIDDRLLLSSSLSPPAPATMAAPNAAQDEDERDDSLPFGASVGGTAAAATVASERAAGADGAGEGDDDDGGGGGREEEEPIFEASFDLTQERLRHVFDTFDTDTDGKIDYESLKRGLEEWQMQAGVRAGSLEGRTFRELVTFLDSDGSGDITFEEFSEGFRLLMLRALLPQQRRRGRRPSSDEVDEDEGDDEGAPLEVLDYDATRLERTKVGGGGGGGASATSTEEAPSSRSTKGSATATTAKTKSAADFFFQRRNDWVKTRWVDVSTSDASDRSVALTMKRLAVKYLLHPLALEDALDEADVRRPKVEVFSSHYFLIIPVFSVERAAPSASERDASDRSTASGKKNGVGGGGDVDLPQQQTQRWHSRLLCSCLESRLGRAARDRLQSGRPPLARVRVEMISIFVNVPRNDTIITCNKGGGGGGGGGSTSARPAARVHLWRERVQRELEKPYSKLRQYDAQYLTYALLDLSVDLLGPVVRAMRHQIADEREYLRRTDFARGLRRVHEIRSNLERVARAVKPFVRVLTHVIEDDAICPGVTVYLRDVLDHLECAEDDLRSLIEQCRELDMDADKFQDRQMNRTLYMLTIISAIFLPAQFLTGVWGMNFEDMPELYTSWGYDMFWIITITMTCVLLTLFCIFGRLRRFED